MPSPDELYMRAKNRAGPYGPDNPPPPPAGSPPAAQQSDIGKQHEGRKDENGMPDMRKEERGYPVHDPYQRRERAPEHVEWPAYEDEVTYRGRPRSNSPSPNFRDPDYHRYRDRSPQRSGSPDRSPRARTSPAVEGGNRSNRRRDDADRRSSGARYRSRSPPFDERRYTSHHSHEYEHEEHRHIPRSYNKNRSLTPVPVRERRIYSSNVPETVYSLREYTNYIVDYHGARRHFTSENRHLPQFRNGDGKVNPSAYGSVMQYDLGLCYGTFKTPYECEMGVKCPWRHHPLSEREKLWIVEIAEKKGRQFIEDAEKFWSHPDVPTPGQNMIEVRHDRQRKRD